jgi:hypothetical protein
MELFRRKKKKAGAKAGWDEGSALRVDETGGGRASQDDEAWGLSMGMGLHQEAEPFARMHPALCKDNKQAAAIKEEDEAEERESLDDDMWEASGVSVGMGLNQEAETFAMMHPALCKDTKQAAAIKDNDRSSVISLGMGRRNSSTVEGSHPALGRDMLQGKMIEASISAGGTSFPIWEKPATKEIDRSSVISLGLGKDDGFVNPMISGNPLLLHRNSKGSGGVPIPLLLQRCATKKTLSQQQDRKGSKVEREDIVDSSMVEREDIADSSKIEREDVADSSESPVQVPTSNSPLEGEHVSRPSVKSGASSGCSVRGRAVVFSAAEQGLHGGLGLLACSCMAVVLVLLLIEGLLGYRRP